MTSQNKLFIGLTFFALISCYSIKDNMQFKYYKSFDFYEMKGKSLNKTGKIGVYANSDTIYLKIKGESCNDYKDIVEKYIKNENGTWICHNEYQCEIKNKLKNLECPLIKIIRYIKNDTIVQFKTFQFRKDTNTHVIIKTRDTDYKFYDIVETQPSEHITIEFLKTLCDKYDIILKNEHEEYLKLETKEYRSGEISILSDSIKININEYMTLDDLRCYYSW